MGKRRKMTKAANPLRAWLLFGALSLLILNLLVSVHLLDVLADAPGQAPTGAVVASVQTEDPACPVFGGGGLGGGSCMLLTQTSATTPTNIAVPPQCLQETGCKMRIVSDWTSSVPGLNPGKTVTEFLYAQDPATNKVFVKSDQSKLSGSGWGYMPDGWELTPSFYSDRSAHTSYWLSNVRYSFGLGFAGAAASSTAGVVPFVGGISTVNGGSRLSDLYWGNVNAFTTPSGACGLTIDSEETDPNQIGLVVGASFLTATCKLYLC